jgi:hypothetical protein
MFELDIRAQVSRVVSGHGNGWEEMTVAVTEFEGLDAASASVDSIADCAGTGARESGLAILLPRFVQRLAPRCPEGVAGTVEPLVQVVVAGWRGVRSSIAAARVIARSVCCL